VEMRKFDRSGRKCSKDVDIIVNDVEYMFVDTSSGNRKQ
jgi:hypothetical protein